MRTNTFTQYVGPSSDLSAAEAMSLLGECSSLMRGKLVDMAKMSIGHTSDLFQFTKAVSDAEVGDFLRRRGDWTESFDATLADVFAHRVRGLVRRNRRMDIDATFDAGDESEDDLQVLSPEDVALQAELGRACRTLKHVTKKESIALEMRVAAVLSPLLSGRDVGNPFGIDEILDALGATSRATYPVAAVWRPLMVRVVSDLWWSINNVYVGTNRLLANRGVLPEIKAVLRARSSRRPRDDRELLPAFEKLMETAGLSAPNDVVVPMLDGDAQSSPVVFSDNVEATMARPLGSALADVQPAGIVAPERIVAELSALSNRRGVRETWAEGDDETFPEVDQVLTLGSMSALYTSLSTLQRVDLPAALLACVPPQENNAQAGVPMNLIPHLRAANANLIASRADRITMDVVGLLFEYIFRDTSIAPGMRELFGRLQIPVVKAALLDRRFFSDNHHPAREFLDHLAAAAAGADDTSEYGEAFREIASDAIETICRDFAMDVDAFDRANDRLVEFIAGERKRLQASLAQHVAEAEAVETQDIDRAEVRVIIRDRLAGLNVPFPVHSFLEARWAKYLVQLRVQEGELSAAYREALDVVDHLLWSLLGKERQAQKTRLARMIPGLVASLRRGMVATSVPSDVTGPFFQHLYSLHIAAIRPGAASIVTEELSPQVAAKDARTISVHDFVAEIAVGTWLTFDLDGQAVTAQLAWVSDKRGRFIFTRHSPSRVLSFAAEELAHALGTGHAHVVVETVPLFDRAVSAALDSLAEKAGPSAVVKATKSVFGARGRGHGYAS